MVLDTLKTGVAIVNIEERIGIEPRMVSENTEDISDKYPCVYFNDVFKSLIIQQDENSSFVGVFKSLFVQEEEIS
jgi:hypothetical protein